MAFLHMHPLFRHAQTRIWPPDMGLTLFFCSSMHQILHRESIGSDLPFPLVVSLRMPLVLDSARSGIYTGSHHSQIQLLLSQVGMDGSGSSKR